MRGCLGLSRGPSERPRTAGGLGLNNSIGNMSPVRPVVAILDIRALIAVASRDLGVTLGAGGHLYGRQYPRAIDDAMRTLKAQIERGLRKTGPSSRMRPTTPIPVPVETIARGLAAWSVSQHQTAASSHRAGEQYTGYDRFSRIPGLADKDCSIGRLTRNNSSSLKRAVMLTWKI